MHKEGKDQKELKKGKGKGERRKRGKEEKREKRKERRKERRKKGEKGKENDLNTNDISSKVPQSSQPITEISCDTRSILKSIACDNSNLQDAAIPHNNPRQRGIAQLDRAIALRNLQENGDP